MANGRRQLVGGRWRMAVGRWEVTALCSLALALAACAKPADAPRAVAPAPFNADSAMSYTRAQLDFGPRVPGTVPARKTGDWIVAHLRSTADTVIEQTWTHTTAKGVKLPLRNILARFKPGAKDRVLYVTHWDTRPVADSDPDPAKRSLPIPGANDGASGVGLLLALGDALKKLPPAVGVDLLFVDGEDYGTFGPDVDVLIGSTYFASHLPEPGYKPLFGVLWEMIGDADLKVYQEINSVQAAPEVVQRVWSQARDLGYENYFDAQAKYPITDDHVPLNKAGLHVIDVIDIDYVSPEMNYHHTMQDTIDKVSVKSLKVMGDVALALVR
jgi:glutaminyl-peptide cyclotransferase